jgi:hypothetical protein
MKAGTIFLAMLIAAVMAASAGSADTLRVHGTAGYLSEWELNADVTSAGPGGAEFSGPLLLKHVGLCSANGPLEKSGRITFRFSKSPSAAAIDATLVIEGAQCRYKGKLAGSSEGFMSCSDGNEIPLKLMMK